MKDKELDIKSILSLVAKNKLLKHVLDNNDSFLSEIDDLNKSPKNLFERLIKASWMSKNKILFSIIRGIFSGSVLKWIISSPLEFITSCKDILKAYNEINNYFSRKEASSLGFLELILQSDILQYLNDEENITLKANLREMRYALYKNFINALPSHHRNALPSQYQDKAGYQDSDAERYYQSFLSGIGKLHDFLKTYHERAKKNNSSIKALNFNEFLYSLLSYIYEENKWENEGFDSALYPIVYAILNLQNDNQDLEFSPELFSAILTTADMAGKTLAASPVSFLDEESSKTMKPRIHQRAKGSLLSILQKNQNFRETLLGLTERKDFQTILLLEATSLGSAAGVFVGDKAKLGLGKQLERHNLYKMIGQVINGQISNIGQVIDVLEKNKNYLVSVLGYLYAGSQKNSQQLFEVMIDILTKMKVEKLDFSKSGDLFRLIMKIDSTITSKLKKLDFYTICASTYGIDFASDLTKEQFNNQILKIISLIEEIKAESLKANTPLDITTLVSKMLDKINADDSYKVTKGLLFKLFGKVLGSGPFKEGSLEDFYTLMQDMTDVASQGSLQEKIDKINVETLDRIERIIDLNLGPISQSLRLFLFDYMRSNFADANATKQEECYNQHIEVVMGSLKFFIQHMKELKKNKEAYKDSNLPEAMILICNIFTDPNFGQFLQEPTILNKILNSLLVSAGIEIKSEEMERLCKEFQQILSKKDVYDRQKGVLNIREVASSLISILNKDAALYENTRKYLFKLFGEVLKTDSLQEESLPDFFNLLAGIEILTKEGDPQDQRGLIDRIELSSLERFTKILQANSDQIEKGLKLYILGNTKDSVQSNDKDDKELTEFLGLVVHQMKNLKEKEDRYRSSTLSKDITLMLNIFADPNFNKFLQEPKSVKFTEVAKELLFKTGFVGADLQIEGQEINEILDYLHHICSNPKIYDSKTGNLSTRQLIDYISRDKKFRNAQDSATLKGILFSVFKIGGFYFGNKANSKETEELSTTDGMGARLEINEVKSNLRKVLKVLPIIEKGLIAIREERSGVSQQNKGYINKAWDLVKSASGKVMQGGWELAYPLIKNKIGNSLDYLHPIIFAFWKGLGISHNLDNRYSLTQIFDTCRGLMNILNVKDQRVILDLIISDLGLQELVEKNIDIMTDLLRISKLLSADEAKDFVDRVKALLQRIKDPKGEGTVPLNILSSDKEILQDFIQIIDILRSIPKKFIALHKEKISEEVIDHYNDLLNKNPNSRGRVRNFKRECEAFVDNHIDNLIFSPTQETVRSGNMRGYSFNPGHTKSRVMHNIMFSEMNLRDTKFENIEAEKLIIQHCQASRMEYKNVKMRHAEFEVVYFKNAIFQDIDIEDSRFKDVAFKGTTIEDSRFKRCNFTNADFSEIKELKKVVFVSCDFTASDLSKIKSAEGVQFIKCKFNGSRESLANLQGVKFTGCEFEGEKDKSTEKKPSPLSPIIPRKNSKASRDI